MSEFFFAPWTSTLWIVIFLPASTLSFFATRSFMVWMPVIWNSVSLGAARAVPGSSVSTMLNVNSTDNNLFFILDSSS